MNIKVWLNQELYLDTVIKAWLDRFSSPLFDEIFKFITDFGSPLAYIVIGLVVFIFLAANKKKLEGVFVITSLFISWLMMLYLKSFWARERPIGEHLVVAEGFSFPSGHAMLSFVFYGFIAYIILVGHQGWKSRTLAIIIYIVILLIGISRVYLNVHYVTDVIAGYLFGGIILIVFIRILEWIKSHRKI